MSLYTLTKQDVKKGGMVLAEAFKDDPMWKPMFKGYSIEVLASFFESPILYGLKYGKVFAPSEDLEGIIVWVPGKYAKMTLWRTIMSGVAFRKQLLPMREKNMRNER